MSTIDSNAIPGQTGDLIKAARDALLYSQDQLARISGVSVSTVARLERGKSVSVESLKAVCAALGLDAAGVRVRERTEPGDAPAPPPAHARRKDPGRPMWLRLARRSGRSLAFLLPVLLASHVLCLFAREVGTQTASASLAAQRAAYQDSLQAIVVMVAAHEVNGAAMDHSRIRRVAGPEAPWKPWEKTKPVSWTACGGHSYLAWWVGGVMGRKDEGDAHCRERSLPLRINRRDGEATEFVAGPARPDEISRLLSLVTGDPSVAVGVVLSPLGDIPGTDAAWFDPRADRARRVAGDDVRFAHIRIRKAAP